MYLQEAMALARRIRHRTALSKVLTNLGVLAGEQGSFQTASIEEY
jgi:hypothetical protein